MDETKRTRTVTLSWIVDVAKSCPKVYERIRVDDPRYGMDGWTKSDLGIGLEWNQWMLSVWELRSHGDRLNHPSHLWAITSIVRAAVDHISCKPQKDSGLLSILKLTCTSEFPKSRLDRLEANKRLTSGEFSRRLERSRHVEMPGRWLFDHACEISRDSWFFLLSLINNESTNIYFILLIKISIYRGPVLLPNALLIFVYIKTEPREECTEKSMFHMLANYICQSRCVITIASFTQHCCQSYWYIHGVVP